VVNVFAKQTSPVRILLETINFATSIKNRTQAHVRQKRVKEKLQMLMKQNLNNVSWTSRCATIGFYEVNRKTDFNGSCSSNSGDASSLFEVVYLIVQLL